MKILLLLENAGAGSGRHVLDLAGGLLAAGDEVHLVYSTARMESAFAAELEAIPGIVTHPIAMQRGLSLGAVREAAAVRRYLRSAGPFDVVHGHSSKGGALARLAALGGRELAVYTPHAFFTLNPALDWPRRLLYTIAERLLGAMSDAVICVSDEERQHATDALGIAADKLAVVVHGLAPVPQVDRGAVRAELGLADNELCIGFVGRLEAQKDIPTLLRAFARVAAERQAVRLMLVGSGDLGDALHALSASLGIADRVTFAGQRDGVRMMAGFDLFALASHYEGFPYVFCEALAAGLPIVTTRVGGASFAVHGGDCGIVVELGDPAALGAAMLSLCDDTPRRRAMAAAASARAAEFSIATMVSAVRSVYARASQRGQGAIAGA